MSPVDLAVIGAGPAGLAAATEAVALGLSVAVLDEQAEPGGQIYRGVERAETTGAAAALGPDYRHGLALVAAFRASGASYLPRHRVWQLERDGRIFASDGERSVELRAHRILVAIGALERPVPVRGWTLPGVMTVGAAQILLKTAGLVPESGVWIAGSGPLPLLYASQVLRAGGRIAGFLDTAVAQNWRRALPYLPGALRNWRYLEKGLGYLAALRRAGVPRIRHVEAIEARGDGHLSTVRFQVRGAWEEVPATGLLLHEGVVPNVHITMAAGCAHNWDPVQRCFRPVLDAWGRSDQPTILVAGDCGGIGGAAAAEHRGRLAALAAAADLGMIDEATRDRRAALQWRALRRHQPIRPFLDRLYAPRAALLAPEDDVVVCRCEGVTAGRIREAVRIGALGPNQAKSFTRAGMGPCQGRLCGLTVTETIAAARQADPGEVGFFRVRPPLKPITLGELAALDQDAA